MVDMTIVVKLTHTAREISAYLKPNGEHEDYDWLAIDEIEPVLSLVISGVHRHDSAVKEIAPFARYALLLGLFQKFGYATVAKRIEQMVGEDASSWRAAQKAADS